MIVTERDREREREREAETQAEGEAGSLHREPDVGFDPGSPGSRPGPKAGAKLLRHPGIPFIIFIANMGVKLMTPRSRVVCLLAMSMSSPVKFLFVSFAHFRIGLFVSLLLSFCLLYTSDAADDRFLV